MAVVAAVCTHRARAGCFTCPASLVLGFLSTKVTGQAWRARGPHAGSQLGSEAVLQPSLQLCDLCLGRGTQAGRLSPERQH